MLLDIKIILIEAIIWSMLWTITVSVSIRVFPFMIEHDYPKDVREIASIPKPSKTHKKQGLIFATVSFVILFGLLIAFAILAYKGQELSFWKIFIHLWLICMIWNIVDLVIVDWIFICLLSLKYFVLRKTEHCKGNKNYKFHFIGFLKGFIAMNIVALIFATISFFILQLLK
ncbi:hypothetical protein MZA43_01720 [Haemophilus influenzae]|uniref:hypothetical protein n=1 Tax=Haemophilus influenzae TaxID=727 RepID=UPI0034DA5AB7|nr:hypothetical protein [Haemophilus influenzae]